MTHLILASQSPRRRELIQHLNLPVAYISANVDEAQITNPIPIVNVIETARLKAHAIAKTQTFAPDTWIVAADTTVALAERMLNKPTNRADARNMLLSLRGRAHFVHTGVVLLNPVTGQEAADVHSATVTMRNYSNEEIDAYIATGDPLDKAGAYGIQHEQFKPVAHLDGCFMGVMGLSICHLIQMITSCGIELRVSLTAVSQAHNQYHNCSIFPQLQQT
ncbi:MAG: septum formation protein Maf [Chloroflexi bacterium]|nr:septum formation protein Maf [Chloroflexota bacterium]